MTGARWPGASCRLLERSARDSIPSDGADELSPAELLVNADIAMHDAKEAWHDRIMLQRPSGRPPGWRAKPTPVSLGVTFPGDLKTRRTKR
jgi:hypothetical protein